MLAFPSSLAAILRWWWPVDEERRAALRWSLLALGLALAATLSLCIMTADTWPELAAKAAAKGKKPRLEDMAYGLMWKALAINTGLLGLLLLCLPIWARPNSLRSNTTPGTASFWRGQGWIILAMLLLAVACRLPRMTLSLYNDEAHNYSRLFSGMWVTKSVEAGPVFNELDWGDTFWRNSGGNNALPYSILARLSLDAAEGLGFIIPGEVCEWAVRLPSLVAGLLSLVLAGWLAWRWLGRPGMVVTLLMLALHPWHVRHSTEARGQSLLFLGIVLGWYCLTLALEQGRWRHWLGYGFSLFLCATSFIGCVYFLLALNVALLARQFWLWKTDVQGADQIWRPVIAGTLAAMAGLQLMLPIIPQMIEILANGVAFRGHMGAAWWQDILGMCMAAVRWGDEDPDNPASLAMENWLPQGWRVGWAVLWLWVVAWGSLHLWRKGGAARLLVIATPAGMGLSWMLASLQGNYLNLWYLFFSVPWIVLALGAAWSGSRRWLSATGLILLLAPMVHVTVALLNQPKQDSRWPVEMAHGDVYPDYLTDEAAKRPITAGFWCNSDLYDPEMVVIRKSEQIPMLIEKARSEGRDLFVTFSHRPNAVIFSPDIVALVEDKDVFDHVGTRYGLEEFQFSQHLYKLKREG